MYVRIVDHTALRLYLRMSRPRIEIHELSKAYNTTSFKCKYINIGTSQLYLYAADEALHKVAPGAKMRYRRGATYNGNEKTLHCRYRLIVMIVSILRTAIYTIFVDVHKNII